MKKLLLPLLAFLLCIASSHAQTLTTSVTVNTTDVPDGQAWANGSYTTALVLAPGTSTATSSPGPSGTLNGSGNATFVLTSQNDISFPTGGGWQVTVCPQMGCAVASYTFMLPAVLGSTQTDNLSPPSFRQPIYSGRPANAYRDSEVISSVLGSEYFNVTLSQLKNCTALPCSANWNAVGVGTGVSSVSGTTNQISVASGGTTPVVSLPSTVIFPSIATIPTLTSPSINGAKSVDGTVYTTVQGAMTGAGANGIANVPTTDAGTDVPSGTRIANQNLPTIASQANGAHLQDFRYGSLADSMYNPGYDNLTNIWSARQFITSFNENLGNAVATPTSGVNNAFGLSMQTNFLSGTQNINQFPGYINKTNTGSIFLTQNTWSAAQDNLATFWLNKYGGDGDALPLFLSSICYGGNRASSDEGCEAIDMNIASGPVDMEMTVTGSPAAGATSITGTYTQGNGTQGVERFGFDLTQGINGGTINSFASTGLPSAIKRLRHRPTVKLTWRKDRGIRAASGSNIPSPALLIKMSMRKIVDRLGVLTVGEREPTLGHTSIVTTQVYTHCTAAHLRSALEKAHPSWQEERDEAKRNG